MSIYFSSLTETCGTVFSRKDYRGPPLVDLLDIIDYVQPTALLGLSTVYVRDSNKLPPLFALTILIPECIHTAGHPGHGCYQPPANHLPPFQPSPSLGMFVPIGGGQFQGNCPLRFRLAFP